MQPFKRTKILATVGPSVDSREAIEQLMTNGVNGFRLNFSHGSYEERERQIGWIREISAELEKPVAILQDLQGPKIRFGNLNVERLDVHRGDEYILDADADHEGEVLPVQYNLASKVKPGEPIYLFDGKINAEILDITSDTAIKIRILNDGYLMSRKAINLPETDFGGDILTPKDMSDIEFGATQDIDYVSLSFVQSAQDIVDLRQLLASHGSDAYVIAKVETKASIEADTLEHIVDVSDGVMVARGDLAVEVGAEMVPAIQQRIVKLCRRYGKLSIVATQMMASMVESPSPTRAEVSDVATAVIQGADVVMLSDETANGKYPVEAVSAMRRTILYTQEHTELMPPPELLYQATDVKRRNAIAHAAVGVAAELESQVIVAETKGGGTAENIAACRPHQPIISVTSIPRVAQRLALTYGTRSYVRPDSATAGIDLVHELRQEGFFGDTLPMHVVVVSGWQPGVSGGTNTIQAHMIR